MFENIVNQIRNKKEIENQEKLATKQQAYERDTNILMQNSAADEVTYNAVQNEKSDLIRWQQDLSDEMVDLVYTLRGYSKGDDNKWHPIMINGKKKKPMCNEVFIHNVIIPQCEPFTSRAMVNSNYAERSINQDLGSTMMTIAGNMADNYDQYDIDFANYDLIIRQIINVIKPNILRSLKGWTHKENSRIIKRVETSSIQPDNSNNSNTIKGIFNSN